MTFSCCRLVQGKNAQNFAIVLCFAVAPTPDNPDAGGQQVYVYSNTAADTAVVWNLPSRSNKPLVEVLTSDISVTQVRAGNSLLQTTAISNLGVVVSSDTTLSLDLTTDSQLSSLLLMDLRDSGFVPSGCGTTSISKQNVPGNLDLMFVNIPSLTFPASTLNSGRSIILAGDCLTAQTDFSFEEEVTLLSNAILLPGPIAPTAPTAYLTSLCSSLGISVDAGLYNLYSNSTRELSVNVKQLIVTSLSDLTPRFINVSNSLTISHPTAFIASAHIEASTIELEGILFTFVSNAANVLVSPPIDTVSISCTGSAVISQTNYTIMTPNSTGLNFVSKQSSFTVSASFSPKSFTLDESCVSKLELSLIASLNTPGSDVGSVPSRSLFLGANEVVVSDYSSGQPISSLDFLPSSVASLTVTISSGHTYVHGPNSTTGPPPAPYTIVIGNLAWATLDVNTLVPLTLPTQYADSSRRLLHLSASSSASAFGIGDCGDRAWFANQWQGALPHFCETQTNAVHIQVVTDMISLCDQQGPVADLSLVIQPASTIDNFPPLDAVPSEKNVYNSIFGLLAACITIQFSK